jgi:hypothetical protein
MEFPKRLLVVSRSLQDGGVEASERLVDLPVDLLPDGVEVAVYGLLRVKRLEVSRRLVKLNQSDPDDEGEGDPQSEPDPRQILLPTTEE